jgi:hypothetical protein
MSTEGMEPMSNEPIAKYPQLSCGRLCVGLEEGGMMEELARGYRILARYEVLVRSRLRLENEADKKPRAQARTLGGVLSRGEMWPILVFGLHSTTVRDPPIIPVPIRKPVQSRQVALDK